MFGCVRDKAYVRPHVSYEVVMCVLFKGGVLEFIGSLGTNSWVVLRESLQNWFKVVANVLYPNATYQWYEECTMGGNQTV